MAAASNGWAFRQIGQLFQTGSMAAYGDRALLDRFVANRDDTAFEAIVVRHGPMVLSVCRRLLRNGHDVDDAFQATFLVLVQRARHLRDADRLGAWLYGVAWKVANRARLRAARNRGTDRLLADPVSEIDDPSQSETFDLKPILDAELARLSAKHREVVMLCLWGGLTPDQAASQIGCPPGTVKSRLARARETLRTRLVGRGVTPVLAATALASLPHAAHAASVPESLLRATLQASASSSTPSALAASIVSLTRGGFLDMVPKPIKMLALGVAGLVVVGVASQFVRTTTAQDEPNAAAKARLQNRRDGDPSQAEGGFKQQIPKILLAVHNYHDANRSLPTYAIFGADGLPKLSWRVTLLPYLGENELYNRFHLDEPWDSPNNKPLLAAMPRVYGGLENGTTQGMTHIRGFLGKSAAFDGVKGLRFQDILDGTSNTALLAVTEEGVPWTKPEGIPFDAKQPIAALDRSNPEGCLLGMLDGAVGLVRLDAPSSAKELRALVTRNGGEVISDLAFRHLGDNSPPTPGSLTPTATPAPSDGAPAAGGGPPGGGGPIPGAAGGAGAGANDDSVSPAIPRELERRLNEIERKLERRLQEIERKLERIVPNRDGEGRRTDLTPQERASALVYTDGQLVPFGRYSKPRPGAPQLFDVTVTYPLGIRQ